MASMVLYMENHFYVRFANCVILDSELIPIARIITEKGIQLKPKTKEEINQIINNIRIELNKPKPAPPTHGCGCLVKEGETISSGECYCCELNNYSD
jgi:hypothetical protein